MWHQLFRLRMILAGRQATQRSHACTWRHAAAELSRLSLASIADPLRKWLECLHRRSSLSEWIGGEDDDDIPIVIGPSVWLCQRRVKHEHLLQFLPCSRHEAVNKKHALHAARSSTDCLPEKQSNIPTALLPKNLGD